MLPTEGCRSVTLEGRTETAPSVGNTSHASKLRSVPPRGTPHPLGTTAALAHPVAFRLFQRAAGVRSSRPSYGRRSGFRLSRPTVRRADVLSSRRSSLGEHAPTDHTGPSSSTAPKTVHQAKGKTQSLNSQKSLGCLVVKALF